MKISNKTNLFSPVVIFLICIGFAFWGSEESACAQTFQEAAGQDGVANLEQRLMSGLRARTDSEKEYLKNVVGFVQQGRLPQKLVDSTFLWVRSKKANSQFPFFYFKRVLELRAKALKLTVPQ